MARAISLPLQFCNVLYTLFLPSALSRSPDDYKGIFVGSGKSNGANESKKQIDSEPKVHLGKISLANNGHRRD